MKDQAMWDSAVSLVMAEYAVLPDTVKDRVDDLAAGIRQEKQDISAFGEKTAAAIHCAACGGQCCEKGKYHFTAIDLLVFLSAGKELFSPNFNGLRCPYLGDDTCLMDPSFRPFTCVTFHCEILEGLLAPADLRQLYVLERRLRSLYDNVEAFFGKRLRQGLLLNYARYSSGGDTGILAGGTF